MSATPDEATGGGWRRRLAEVRASGLATESLWGLFYEGATVLSAVVSFWLLGRTLGAGGYGAYASLYAIIAPLLTLAGSGLTLSLMQHVVRDGEPLQSTIRSCYTLVLLIGSILVVGAGIAVFLIVDQLSVTAIVTLLLVEFIVTPTLHIVATTLQITVGFISASKLRLLYIGLRTVILIGLALAGRLTVASLGVVTLIGCGTLAIIAVFAVERSLGCSFRPGRVAWPHLRSNLQFSTAISASSLGNEGDKTVMAVNKMVVETGLYAAAYRIVQFGMMPIASVVAAGHVRFLENQEGVRRQHLDRALRYARFALVYGIVAAVALIVAAPLFPLVFGDSFQGSVVMMQWLAPVLVVRSLGAFSLNGLIGLGHLGARTVLILVNTSLCMVLYITLIPEFGWQGAIAGTLIGETLDVGVSWAALVYYQRRADRELDLGATGVA